MENTLENRQCGMRVFREKSQKKKFWVHYVIIIISRGQLTIGFQDKYLQ